MALEVETGTFDKSTGAAPATQNITVGFDPKAVIIWGILRAPVDDTLKRDHGQPSMGFCDDADNNRCISARSQNTISISNCHRKLSDTRVLQFINSVSNAIDSECTMTLGTLQFQLIWDVNDSIAARIHYMAFGGADITGTQVNHITKSTAAAPVTQTITTDADVQGITDNKGIVFLLNGGVTDFNIASDLVFNLGVATAGAGEEGNIQISCDDNAGTSIIRESIQDNEILSFYSPSSGTIDTRGVFQGFNSSGFDITWNPNSANAFFIPYLIIKGGQWESGNDTAKITTTGNKSTTTIFQPKALLTFILRKTTNGNALENAVLSLGAVEGTTETTMTYYERGAAAITVVNIGSSITKLNQVIEFNTVLSEAELASFNATDFTLNYTTVDANAYKFIWVVGADDAVGATTKTFLIDAILQKVQQKIFALDARLVNRLTKTFSLDAILQAIQTKTFSVDSILQQLRTKIFVMDALLQQTKTRIFSMDAMLQEKFTKVFSLDARLVNRLTKTFSMDAVLDGAVVPPGTKTKTFTMDAFLFNDNQQILSARSRTQDSLSGLTRV